ncbi:MAG: hypothetical protein R3A10_08890 [Caldilineaceae bacterium]
MDGNHGAALGKAAEMLQSEHGIDMQLALYGRDQLAPRRGLEARLAADVAAKRVRLPAPCSSAREMVRPMQGILAQVETPVTIITGNPALIRCTHMGRLSLEERNDNESVKASWGAG